MGFDKYLKKNILRIDIFQTRRGKLCSESSARVKFTQAPFKFKHSLEIPARGLTFTISIRCPEITS